MQKNVIEKLEKIAKEKNNQGRLAAYLLNYEGDLLDLKIRMICDDIYVSVATATRLAKRLELNGFNELRIYLIEELKERDINRNQIRNISIDNYYTDIKNSLDKTLSITSFEQIKIISSELMAYNNIDFYAVGGSNVILQDIAYKLARLKKRVSVYSDTHLQYVQAMNSDQTTMAFALSYSGTTEEILNMLKIAKVNGAKTILMTHNQEIDYEYVDYVIPIDSTELSCRTYSITSRIAALTILDLLYLKMIDSDFEHYQTILEKTRKQK